MYRNISEDLKIKQTPPWEPRTLHVTKCHKEPITWSVSLLRATLNMELNLRRTEFENADWTERGRNKVQRKLHVSLMQACGVICTYTRICYIIPIFVRRVADVWWAATVLRVHSIFTSVTHDLYRLLIYLYVEKNTLNKLKEWNAKRLYFSIMLQINLAGYGGSVSNNGAIETDVKAHIHTLMEYKQAER